MVELWSRPRTTAAESTYSRFGTFNTDNELQITITCNSKQWLSVWRQYRRVKLSTTRLPSSMLGELDREVELDYWWSTVDEDRARVDFEVGIKISRDQFSFLGNRARYEFIELDMSTVLDLSIPSSRPLTFPGGQSKNGYRARWLIELGDLSSSVFQEKKKREKMEIKAIITTWSTKSKTPSTRRRL